jgi:hypothetical protein
MLTGFAELPDFEGVSEGAARNNFSSFRFSGIHPLALSHLMLKTEI